MNKQHLTLAKDISVIGKNAGSALSTLLVMLSLVDTAWATTPVQSSLELTATADFDNPAMQPVVDAKSDSQTATLKPLTVSVLAQTSLVQPYTGSVISSGDATASWANAESGTIDFNVGYDFNVGRIHPEYYPTSYASLSGNGWRYTFIPDHDGVFELKWNVKTTAGSPGLYSDFLFCLDNCYTAGFRTLSNTEASETFNLLAGHSYIAMLNSLTNLYGVIGPTKQYSESGHFQWTIKTSEVPLPSGLHLFGSAVAGMMGFRVGKKIKSQEPLAKISAVSRKRLHPQPSTADFLR
jgi:hypothetical protein